MCYNVKLFTATTTEHFINLTSHFIYQIPPVVARYLIKWPLAVYQPGKPCKFIGHFYLIIF